TGQRERSQPSGCIRLHASLCRRLVLCRQCNRQRSKQTYRGARKRTHKGFTYSRRPVTLVWSEYFERITDAIAAEQQLKGWSRAKKGALILRGPAISHRRRVSELLRPGASG